MQSPQLFGMPAPEKRPGLSVFAIVLIIVVSTLLVAGIGGAILVSRIGGSDGFACTELTAKGMYKEAIPPCRALVKRMPNSGDAHNELGWDLALDGQVPEALAECQKAVGLKPNSTNYDSLAMAQALSGQGEEALRTEKEHVMVNGVVQNDEERLTLGMAYYAIGRKSDARRQWELARVGTSVTGRKLAAEFEAKYPDG